MAACGSLAADFVAQGFQTICTVASRNFSLLEEYDAENISLPLTFTADPSKSRWTQPRVCSARAPCFKSFLRMFGGLSSTGLSTLSSHGVCPCPIPPAPIQAPPHPPPSAAVTMNNHHFGVSPDAFASDARLSSLFNVLSTNNDR